MRHFLYYSLGLIPNIFFSLRFFIQWIKSERAKKSHVDSTFWKLSLAGNLLLACHYYIQFQLPFLLIQTGNAFIAWRNLNFLQRKKEPYSLRFTWIALITSQVLVFLAFWLQKQVAAEEVKWLNVPIGLKHSVEVSLYWHLFGLLGGVLFGSRFWIQWWVAEKKGESYLGRPFWITSLIGSVIASTYFFYIKDWVSSFSYLFALIPYMRNLILLRKSLSST
ncbi:MAG: lipid-A-disaccharide synthase N-terminal domain-containing protein [Chlamydiales bacterium]